MHRRAREYADTARTNQAEMLRGPGGDQQLIFWQYKTLVMVKASNIISQGYLTPENVIKINVTK